MARVSHVYRVVGPRAGGALRHESNRLTLTGPVTPGGICPGCGTGTAVLGRPREVTFDNEQPVEGSFYDGSRGLIVRRDLGERLAAALGGLELWELVAASRSRHAAFATKLSAVAHLNLRLAIVDFVQVVPSEVGWLTRAGVDAIDAYVCPICDRFRTRAGENLCEVDRSWLPAKPPAFRLVGRGEHVCVDDAGRHVFKDLVGEPARFRLLGDFSDDSERDGPQRK